MLVHIKNLSRVFILFVGFFLVTQGVARAEAPNMNLVTNGVVKDIKAFLFQEIVLLSVDNQNKKYAGMSQGAIDALDQQWKAETKAEDQPLISATLSNPLSSYLTRVQAHSKGLYTEMFVMDKNGLNVGQSNISSDFWQGDEAKFQKTFSVGPEVVFIDEPELDEELGLWLVQISFSIKDPKINAAMGAATIELNLTELQRRSGLKQPLQN
jgi:hypothetical protein